MLHESSKTAAHTVTKVMRVILLMLVLCELDVRVLRAFHDPAVCKDGRRGAVLMVRTASWRITNTQDNTKH